MVFLSFPKVKIGLNELRCVLHEKDPAEVTARPLSKSLGFFSLTAMRNLTTKTQPLVTVSLMEWFSQQMRPWPRTPEESEIITNFHAKDAKMFPAPCGCKATTAATQTSREVRKRPGRESSEILRFWVCSGFPRKTKHAWE